MSEDSSELVYVAQVTVQNESPSISAPQDIVDAGIITPGEKAWWSFEEVTGILLLSNKKPSMDAYKPVGKNTVQKHENMIRLAAPLQEDPADTQAKLLQDQYVPEEALIERSKRYHFIYRNDGMASGEVRSCYLLSDEEVIQRLSSPSDWGDNFAEVPEFF